MTVNNFIPEVWSGRFMQTLQKALVYAGLCNRNWEGDIREAGDTVRITSVGPVTVAPYVKNSTTVTAENLTDDQAVLKIDECNFFAFKIEDVDAAQAKGNILGEGMRNAAYAMRDTVDQYVADILYAEASSVTALTPVNSLNVLAILTSLGQALDELNIPSEGRWAIIPPWFKTKLVHAKSLVENTTNDAWTNGKVGRVAGFDLSESNNVPITSGTDYKIIAGTSMAATYAEQINKVEAYRLEGGFSDAVKGLHLCGAKVIQSDALAVADCSILAEP